MEYLTKARTTVYLTDDDKQKIETIKKKENLHSIAAALRWAINEVLK